jgi:hypothetical protein
LNIITRGESLKCRLENINPEALVKISPEPLP